MFFGALIIGAHCCACFWIMLSSFNDYNWLANKIASLSGGGEEITLEDNLDCYFIALYFTIQTITTVGYGDVNPANMSERIFVICLMLAGVIAFSFIAGGLTGLITALDEKNSEISATDDRL